MYGLSGAKPIRDFIDRLCGKRILFHLRTDNHISVVSNCFDILVCIKLDSRTTPSTMPKFLV